MAQATKEEKARGIVLISGNKYMTTAGRVMAIHEKYPGCVQISTEILNDDELKVEMMATVEITDETGTRKFTGFAREHYEVKTQKDVNYASALENCETSAVGRAIGFAGVGLLPGSGCASADEIEGIGRKEKAVKSQQIAKNNPEPVEGVANIKDAKKKKTATGTNLFHHVWDLAQERGLDRKGMYSFMSDELGRDVSRTDDLNDDELKKVYDALKAREDVEVAL